MKEILEFVETPLFKANFSKFDRKLSKNIIKRCAVDPLCSLFTKDCFDTVQDKSLMIDGTLKWILVKLTEKDFCTDTLKEKLSEALE